MNKLEDLIKTVPSAPSKSETACPACRSRMLDKGMAKQTLLGSEEMNHHWVEYACRQCGLEFTKQWRGDEVWYVSSKNILLMGINGCFEDVSYACRCGGTVSRRWVNLDGSERADGDYAQIGSSGDSAQIGSSGYSAKIGSEGKNSVVSAIGAESRAKAKAGSWIVLAEWKSIKGERTPVCVKSGQVGKDGLKADTWYCLKDGEFKEVG